VSVVRQHWMFETHRGPAVSCRDNHLIIIIIIIIIVSLYPKKWPLIAHYLLQKAVNCSFCDTSTAHLHESEKPEFYGIRKVLPLFFHILFYSHFIFPSV
jgi:hypothetical protein